MTSSQLFVWIYLSNEARPVLAARITFSLTNAMTVGRFVYGREYLARKDAIAIDPVALPLCDAQIEFTSLNGLPGAVADSCPDKWGMNVIDKMGLTIKTEPFPVGYLLLNDPGRVGALAFSTDKDRPPVELNVRQFSIAELLQAAIDIESNKEVDAELLKALHPGTGGARPKCNIIGEDGVWLAKFPSVTDKSVSNPRLEHATMMLAGECGLNVAKTKIVVVNGVDICMVKRFDREIVNGEIHRKSFLSARTMFYGDPGFARSGTGSYARIARWLPKYGADQRDKHELYRRMVFNVAVHNSDDHELNHGLISDRNGRFSLSPAYDIVPSLHDNLVHRHALLIGSDANGTIESLLESVAAFDLSREDAAAIIREIELSIKDNWLSVAYEAGFGDDDVRIIEKCFMPIPLDASHLKRRPGPR